MSGRLLFVAIAISALAFMMRFGSGPGNAYLHGINGSSDEHFYISEGFFLSSALGDVKHDRLVRSSGTSPILPLYLSLAPLVSPFRFEESGPLPVTRGPQELRSPDGEPWSIAYLNAGSDEKSLQAAYQALIQDDYNRRYYEETPGYREAADLLAQGKPAFLSAFRSTQGRDESGAFRVAEDPLIRTVPEGARLIDRETGETIVLLASDGVDSLAISVGHDDPFAVVIATIDRSDVLRVWRFRNTSQWVGDLGLLVLTERLEEAAAISPGPSGDLLLVSARRHGEWRLLTYETVGGSERIGDAPAPGRLRFVYDPSSRTTGAIDEVGRSWSIVGGPLIGVRLLISLAAAIGTLIAVLIGRRVAGLSGAIGGGLLFALDPLGVELGRTAYLEQLLATETIATLGALVAASTSAPARRGRWLAIAGVLAGLACATKLSAFPLAIATIYVTLSFASARVRRWSGAAWLVAAAAIAGGGIAQGLLGPLLGGAALMALGLSLVRRGRNDAMPFSRLVIVACSMLAAYLIPWAIRSYFVWYMGLSEEPFELIVAIHREISWLAAWGAEAPGSAWWLWPSGLEMSLIESAGLWNATFIPGLLLAAGLAAVGGARQRTELFIAVALMLAWSNWAFFGGYQKAYYAQLSSVVAAVMIMMAARYRGEEGRVAIPLALLAPIGAAFFYASYLDGALFDSVAAISGLAAASYLCVRRRVLLPVAVIAWLVAGLSAVATAHFDLPLLAIVAGLSAGVAGSGGWRAAPFGVAAVGAAMLVPQIRSLIGYPFWREAPTDIAAGSLDFHLHPAGLAISMVIVSLMLIHALREGRRSTKPVE